MKATDINKIIKSQSSVEIRDVFDKYKLELKEYKKLLAKKGSYISFKIIKDESININKNAIIALCKRFLDKTLSGIEINFLVDNIWASNANYDSDKLEKLLEEFTDPEINGVLTYLHVRGVLERLAL